MSSYFEISFNAELFGLIPPEIINLIVLQLDDKTKRIVRLLNKQWFSLIDYSHFTLFFTRPDTLTAIIDRFAQYNKPIGLYFKKNLRLTTEIVALSRLTNLTSLEIDKDGGSNSDGQLSDQQWMCLSTLTNLQHFSANRYNRCEALLKHFPKLTSFVQGPRDDKVQLELIIPHLTALRSLSLNYNSSKILSKIPRPDLLTHLAVEHSGGRYNLKDLAPMTNLKRLILNEDQQDDHNFDLTIWPHLESLWILGRSIRFDSVSQPNTKLTELTCRIDQNNIRTAQSLSLLKNLRVLSYSGEKHEFLENLRQLDDLTVTLPDGDQNSSDFIKFINSSRLTRLTIDNPTKSIDLASSSHLLSLLQLTINCSYANYELDYRSIGSLINLTLLTLYSPNKINPSIRRVSTLTNLKGLKIKHRDRAIDLDLAPLTCLESVILSCLIKQSTYDSLTALVNLTNLTFKVLSGQDFSKLTKFTRLCVLDVGTSGTIACNNRILWDSLQQLTTLEHLEVTSINDGAKFDTLTCLTRLTAIQAYGYNSKSVPELSFSRLTTLQFLRLSKNQPMLPDHYSTRHCQLTLPYLYKYSLV